MRVPLPGSRRVAAALGRLPLALLLLLAAATANAQRTAAVASRETVAAASPRTFATRAVGPVELTVSDMDRALEFYTKVLAFEKVSDVEVAGEPYERMQGVFGVRLRIVRLRLGDEQLELTDYLTPEGRAVPEDSRGNDRWFQHVAIIVSDMDSAYARLRRHKVQHASTGPQTLPAWNTNAAGIRAFYFRDPDDHFLEVLWFPPGKGAAKWHRRDGRLFLGIDHTAIVVASTAKSLRFYQEQLGLAIAGSSDNHGTEQEHLNNVEGARLRITTLRAADGPGIELLEYVAPRTGRPYPADARPNDVLHWQTTLLVSSVDAAARALTAAGYTLVSRGVVALPDVSLGIRKAALVRDPDGHVMELAEP